MTKSKIILVGVLLCAGCNDKNKDVAKFEALDRKLDTVLQTQAMICSNQVAMLGQLQALQAAEARLPDVQTVNSIMLFYHTNELNAIGDGIIGSGQITLTNLYRLEAGQYDIQQSLWKLDSRVGNAEFILTNDLADFIYIREKSDPVPPIH